MDRFEDLPDVRDGIRRAVARHAALDSVLRARGEVDDGVNGRTSRDTWVREADYTSLEKRERDARRNLANICDAVMMRVVDLEQAGDKLDPLPMEWATVIDQVVAKLRAAVVANT